MAQGRPTKWASVKIKQDIWLDKSGIEIVVWDKFGRKQKALSSSLLADFVGTHLRARNPQVLTVE